MNIWKRLRHKIDIPTNEIANLLHIPEKKYIEIEKGVRQMPKNLINNFMKIYHERKEIKGETQIKMFEVNQFLKTMDLKELRKEFNYDSNEKLAKAIGIGEAMIYRLKSNLNAVSDNTKIKVYNFFNDPLNIQIDNKKHTIDDSAKLVNKIMQEQGLSQTALANKIGVVSSVVSNWARGKRGMNLTNYNKLIELDNGTVPVNEKNISKLTNLDKQESINISNIISEEEIEDINDIVSDVQEPSVEENDAIQKLNAIIDNLRNENTRIKQTISRYEKLIDRL